MALGLPSGVSPRPRCGRRPGGRDARARVPGLAGGIQALVVGEQLSNRVLKNPLFWEASQKATHKRSGITPPGTSSTRRGRPGGRGARARVPGLAGGIQTRFDRVVVAIAMWLWLF
jgi:hypothetical protein